MELNEKNIKAAQVGDVLHDATVQIDGVPLVEAGRLVALDDPAVHAAAAAYGDPLDVLASADDPAGAPG